MTLRLLTALQSVSMGLLNISSSSAWRSKHFVLKIRKKAESRHVQYFVVRTISHASSGTASCRQAISWSRTRATSTCRPIYSVRYLRYDIMLVGRQATAGPEMRLYVRSMLSRLTQSLRAEADRAALR